MWFHIGCGEGGLVVGSQQTVDVINLRRMEVMLFMIGRKPISHHTDTYFLGPPTLQCQDDSTPDEGFRKVIEKGKKKMRNCSLALGYAGSRW